MADEPEPGGVWRELCKGFALSFGLAAAGLVALRVFMVRGVAVTWPEIGVIGGLGALSMISLLWLALGRRR